MKYVFAFFLLIIASLSIVFAEEVMSIGELKPDMSATIEGKVVRVLDEDEFLLKDETGSIEVYIGWKNKISFQSGEKLTVQGVVDDDDDDDDSHSELEFYAAVITREDGSVIELQRD